MDPAPRQIDRDDTVFVALEHKLRLAVGDVPELDRAVFGSGDNPLAVWGDGNGEDVVLFHVSDKSKQEKGYSLCGR